MKDVETRSWDSDVIRISANFTNQGQTIEQTFYSSDKSKISVIERTDESENSSESAKEDFRLVVFIPTGHFNVRDYERFHLSADPVTIITEEQDFDSSMMQERKHTFTCEKETSENGKKTNSIQMDIVQLKYGATLFSMSFTPEEKYKFEEFLEDAIYLFPEGREDIGDGGGDREKEREREPRSYIVKPQPNPFPQWPKTCPKPLIPPYIDTTIYLALTSKDPLFLSRLYEQFKNNDAVVIALLLNKHTPDRVLEDIAKNCENEDLRKIAEQELARRHARLAECNKFFGIQEDNSQEKDDEEQDFEL